MLATIEKLQYILSGIILLLVLGFLLLFGLPESSALPHFEAVSSRRIESPAAAGSGRPGGTETRPRLTPRQRAELRSIQAAARRHGLRSINGFEEKEYRVPRRAFEILRKPGNWLPELNKAASVIHRDSSGRPTMVEIDDIEPGSFFERFGFENGDQVLLVDGAVMEFDSSQSQRYVEKAEEVFGALERGEPFSITVIRNGQPVQMEFRLEDLRAARRR